MFSLFVYLFKKLHKRASEFSSRLELWWLVPTSTVMTMVAIFKIRLLKMAAAKKISHNLRN